MKQPGVWTRLDQWSIIQVQTKNVCMVLLRWGEHLCVCMCMYDSYMYMYGIFYNNVGILNRVRIRALDLDLNSVLLFPGCDWLKSNKDDDVLSLKNENLQIKDILGIATKVSNYKPQRCALANWSRRILQGTCLPLGKGGESNLGKERRRNGHRTPHC